ncbi:MAG: YiiD C-terminal domain-containing protein [Mycolicibacterium sp.]|nr:YiiD C-terminal domain-containing protein [Mycolicibacterium sp.]
MNDDLAEFINTTMKESIPAAFQMGVRVVEARRGFASATVPLEGNGNHFGVVYAGVQFTVAEVLGGIIALATFDTAKFFPLVRGFDIEFTSMAKSELHAEATLDPSTIADIEATAERTGKADFTLTAVVKDSNDHVVATTSGRYQLRSHR